MVACISSLTEAARYRCRRLSPAFTLLLPLDKKEGGLFGTWYTLKRGTTVRRSTND